MTKKTTIKATNKMTYDEAINVGGMKQEEYEPFIEYVKEIIIKGGEIFAASVLSSLTMSAKSLSYFELLICSDGDFELNDWNIDNPQSIGGTLSHVDDIIDAVNLLTPHLNDYRASLAIAS